jgi:phosphate transport system substrate-binding protein
MAQAQHSLTQFIQNGFLSFHKENPANEINYQSIGSGGGIRQLLDKTIDFGASDAPMTDEQLAKSSVKILHIPTVLGAVVLTYNLPSVPSDQELKLTPEIISEMFLGKIKKWDDAKITSLNPKLLLPKNLDVLIVHRSDGSGTTAVFSDYLAKVSPEWKTSVGSGTALSWPTGLGGKGNEGVTGTVKNTPGAIGYVELVYADTNKMPTALIKNAAGNFVKASPAAVTVAAESALKDMPADFRVSITNAGGKNAYPISSFTYILVYQKMDSQKANAMKGFLSWAMEQGQKMAEPLSYAPLPKKMVPKIKNAIQEIRAQ